MFLTGCRFGEGEKPEYPEKKPHVRVRLTETQPTYTIAEVGGANVKHNTNLPSPGIQHRNTRMVTHPDTNPAQQDLTSMTKWELPFSLRQAIT